MANTLKVITADANKTNASGTTSTTANVDTTLYTVPSAKTAIIVGFHVCNILTNTIKITVTISSDTANASAFGGGNNRDSFLVKNVPIPEGSTIELLSGNKIFLNTTDIIKIQSDTAVSINCVLSFVEQDV